MMVSVHRALRIASTALITAGLVLLVDVGVTLAWKEPVSSFYGAIQQLRAENQLDELEESFRSREPDVSGLADRRAARMLADAFEDEIETGRAIGRIDVPRLDLDAVVLQGTDTATLRLGPAHYEDTGLPGQGKTIGVAGHRTTYLAPFRTLDRLEQGDELSLRMPYGVFTYELERQRVVEPSEVGIVRDVRHERLVLTACHPLYSASERYAVFARLVEIELRERDSG